ncbi:MAG: hypothetical protein AAF985_26860 [Bacteroidota bacterium]
MKKKFILFCTTICMILGLNNKALSQGNSFYVELFGNGLIFSANYDMRFTQSNVGLGGRVGLGYVGGVNSSVLTIPVMANYLLGKDGKYFEVGGGLTFVSANVDFIGDNDSASAVWGTLSFMYRYQPIDGGFMWKIGITPLIADGVFFPYWFGLGLGYCW